MAEDKPIARAHKPSSWPHRLFILAVMALATAVRLINLRSSPGWYHDECIFVLQSWNLMHGQFLWDAAQNTFLPHMPLFHLLAGIPMLLFGEDILFVRLVAALSGIGMTWLVYRTARLLGGRRESAIGAALFAICPYVVLMNRWGFTYNLAAVLGLANLFFLLRFWQKRESQRYLWLAALACSFSLVTHPIMAPRFLLTAGTAFVCVRPLRAAAVSLATLIPLALYIAIMSLFHGVIFAQDISVILSGRVSGSSDWLTLGSTFSYYLNELGGYGYLGLIGLAFIPAVRGYGFIIAAFALDLLANLKLASDDLGRIYRMGIILAPTLFVGLGFLLDDLSRRVTCIVVGWTEPAFEWHRRRRGEKRARSLQHAAAVAGQILAWLALLCLMLLMSMTVWRGIATSFGIVPKDFMRATLPGYEIPDAEAAAEWLAPQLNADDLIVVTHINWMFHCRTVSPMLAQAAEGESKNPIYHSKLSDRLIYPCRMRDARFAITHAATPGLVAVYGLEKTIRPVFDEWTLVWRMGRVSIYANPANPRNAEKP